MPLPNPQQFVTYTWLVWIVSWWIGALWSDRAAKSPAAGSGLAYRVAVIAGAVLLFGVNVNRGTFAVPLWTVGPVAAWICAAITVAGLAFCWWARLHIGRLWSTSVDRKADHRVIDTGPYAIVRHPIYAGIIVAAFAAGVLNGHGTALMGAAFLTFGFWLRARLEERFLRGELGTGVYDAYRRRVPMLVPFGPTGG
jgi:protein-S-isoprenylcysteine O-methyltransferase Ste14